MDFLKKELGPLVTATRAIIIKEPPNIYSDHIGDKNFDHYIRRLVRSWRFLTCYTHIHNIIMPEGEYICRTKLPLQDIPVTLVSTLQVTVFSCSFMQVTVFS